MAEYGSQRSEQPQNFNFEPIVRGLEIIFLTGTVKSVSRFNHIRKKWGQKMDEKNAIRCLGDAHCMFDSIMDPFA